MRIAILSDIHGNQFGLEAVLEDITPKNVDGYWFLGDYCFGGGDPIQVLETITRLPNAIYIRGNADRMVFDPPKLEDVVDLSPEQIKRTIESYSDLSWTIGTLAHKGWVDWLADLPLDYRATLPDGTQVLLVHAAPNTDYGRGIKPEYSDEEVRERFCVVEDDLIIVGHTHKVQERRLDGKHIVNVGCIGKPVGTELRASYAILDADEQGYTITMHFVAYDTEAFLARLREVYFPTPEYMETYYRGQFVPTWER